MGRTRAIESKKRNETVLDADQGDRQPLDHGRQGVFISHASEDAPLAKAFSELIQDVSSGMVQSFSSSSTEEQVGIPYGKDWFDWIEERIRDSATLVALITPTSVGRPWILFEAGYGRAIEGVRVFGLRLGTTGEDAYVGPFKALQNSAGDADEILKLCRQLLEGTQCRPRDEKVKEFVAEFLSKVDAHFKSVNETPKKATPESEAVFRALEEMKGLVQTSRMNYGDDWDDMRMFDLERVMEMTLHRSKEVDPALRVTLLLGLVSECGFAWIVPTIEHALRAQINVGALEMLLMKGEFGMRRMRRMPFPPDMLLHELIRAVEKYQHLRFRGRRTSLGLERGDVESEEKG